MWIGGLIDFIRACCWGKFKMQEAFLGVQPQPQRNMKYLVPIRLQKD